MIMMVDLILERKVSLTDWLKSRNNHIKHFKV